MAKKADKTTSDKRPVIGRETSVKSERIIEAIIEQTMWRVRQNIDTWRGAIQAAENVLYPQRIYLYSLYEEIVLDSHIEGITGQRSDGLLAEKFKLTDKDGNKLPDIQAMFESQWFYDIMSLSLEAVYWGHSLIQLWDPIPGKGFSSVELVPRRNVVPETGGVAVLQGDIYNTIYYRQAPYSDWLIEAMPKGPRNHGLFKIAAPDFIIKKNAKLNWAQFSEIFGMPMRVGKTASRNQADAKKLSDRLKAMGAACSIVMQEGESIEIKESTKTDSYNVYDKLIERCNAELSKLFIRQTMTVEDGSSRSQGEVHERILDVLKETDKRMFLFIAREQVIPKMIKHGLIPEGTKWEWEQSMDLEALWKKVQGALQAGFEVDAAWIKETFGFPIGERMPTPPGDNEDPEDGNTKVDKGKKPAGDKQNPGAGSKKKSLMLSIGETYKAGVCLVCGGAKKLKPLRLAIDSDAIAKTVWDNKDEDGNIDTDAFGQTAGKLWDGFKSGYGTGFKKLGAAGVVSSIQNNLYTFSAAKTLAQMNAMRDMIGKDGIKSFDDFKKNVQAIGTDFNETWLQTEYNNVVAGGQMGARWQQYQEDQDEYPNLKYTTVGDDRVREEHRALEGITLPLNDAFWNKYYPPNGWNCRCTVEQMDSDAHLDNAKTAGKIAKDDAKVVPLFQNNVGKSGIIFKGDHPYFQNAAGQLKELNYKSYGMPSIDDVKRSGLDKPEEYMDDKDQYKTWVKNILDGNDTAEFTSYDQTPVTADKNALNHVMENKDGQHWEISNNLADIIQTPSESFLLDDIKVWIKHFKDTSLIALAELDKDYGWLLQTWYEWNGKADIENLRKGILMYRSKK